ncbi:hypothetical protein [Bosea sp. RCC_152_1]|uniref:hypothetical protein n=1 Tax=Bosea sp. RCC_152_1 TaxID=3239228 RepID=UPI003523F31F
MTDAVVGGWAGGTESPPAAPRKFRKETGPTTYDPKHPAMENRTSPDEIAAILGPVDPMLIAEMGTALEELAETWAWINADDALINAGRPLPSGRVAEFVALLEPFGDDAAG